MKELKAVEERKAEEAKQNVCQICQEALFTYDNAEVFALGVCSDVYHVECINPWLATCIENQ